MTRRKRARVAVDYGRNDTEALVSAPDLPRWQAREIAAGLRLRADWHERQGSLFIYRRLRELAARYDEL